MRGQTSRGAAALVCNDTMVGADAMASTACRDGKVGADAMANAEPMNGSRTCKDGAGERSSGKLKNTSPMLRATPRSASPAPRACGVMRARRGPCVGNGTGTRGRVTGAWSVDGATAGNGTGTRGRGAGATSAYGAAAADAQRAAPNPRRPPATRTAEGRRSSAVRRQAEVRGEAANLSRPKTWPQPI